ncbi:MAG: HNH endonuclease [Epsilonproteobacteria bacterium]|nr:HNH endonuclease [Campylobacterota bacterium]
MAKITNDMIAKAYEEAKLVYFGRKSQTDAQDDLNDFELNRNSAGDLIVNFRCMMDGQKFTRTNNAYTTKYYLENISKDYGKEKLANALSALEQHIEYYEELQNTTMHKIRAIFNDFKNKEDFVPEIIYPDEVETNLLEGSKKQVTVNSYERNPIARKKCLEHFGYNCSVCNINFEKVYGVIGKNFIHVHHLKQISEIQKEYEVNPTKDLIPVCPNCHAMLHKRNPPYSINELKDITKHRSQ